jgi:RHS repeat-associated protein
MIPGPAVAGAKQTAQRALIRKNFTNMIFQYPPNLLLPRDGSNIMNTNILHSSLRSLFTSTTAVEEVRYFYNADHLGSTSFVSDRTGTPLQYLSYDPFGSVIYNQKAAGSSYNTDWQFSGKFFDAESKYHYFGARYYNSDIGVWLSVDPLAHKYPSTSPYAYCLNNPVILVDPDGKDPIYKQNFWGRVKQIGDDGKNSTGSYLVRRSIARDVKAATKAGNFYTGSLVENKNVMHIPTGQIQQDVQQTVNATINSGTSPDTRVENGGHSLHGDTNARIWDPGSPLSTSTDAAGNTIKTWSIRNFKIGGKNNQVGGHASSIQYIWHTHPNGSEPSTADINAVSNWRSNGFKGNPFLIDVNNGRVTFYDEKGSLMNIRYDDFKRMGNQELMK